MRIQMEHIENKLSDDQYSDKSLEPQNIGPQIRHHEADKLR